MNSIQKINSLLKITEFRFQIMNEHLGVLKFPKEWLVCYSHYSLHALY